MRDFFSTLQNAIYFQGQAPRVPIGYDEREAAARARLELAAYDYIAGGAGSERTMARNRAAFDRWALVPRMMRDLSSREYSTQIFQANLPAPLALAPVGQLGAVHGDAEVACGRAAATVQLPLILSTVASKSLEEVAQAMGHATRWFQLYWPNDPALTESFVTRAERAGYSALFVTLDTRLLGWRERDLGRAHLPFLQGIGLANYFSDPVFCQRLAAPPAADLPGAILEFAKVWPHVSWTWRDLKTLRHMTSMPIILKGVLHPDDARQAVDAGVEGIVVSNHGGRQVDGSLGALEALPEVVAAVRDQIPIAFDSGVRNGPDMMKALALGAQLVLVGRPYVWGLALDGEAGVLATLQYLLAEFDLTMALSGCTSLRDLSPQILREVHAH